jgi:hypothetical protein
MKKEKSKKKNMPQEKFQSLQECKEHIVRRLAFQIEKIQSEADTIRFILESVDMRISQWKKDKKRMCINGIGELQGTARTFEYLCTEISLLEEMLNKFELEENHENIPHSPTN